MVWLNAALAFAITMLVLSMVTSVFVETLHRIIGLRERGLRLMLGHIYDRVIAPHVTRQGGDAAALKTLFVDMMTVNRAPAGAAGAGGKDAATTKDLSADDRAVDSGLLGRIWSGRRLARLGPDQFMERLGGSEFGDMIRASVAESGLADPAAALEDVAQKFRAFGGEASVFFERRARLASILAAIVVAWLMYVNPYDLFKTYMENPEVTAAVIDKQETILAGYEAKQKLLIEAAATEVNAKVEGSVEANAAQAASEAAALAADVEAAPDAAALAAAEKDATDAAAKQADKALELARTKLKEAVAMAELVTDQLQAAGVPIGWTEARLEAAGFVADPWFGLPWPWPVDTQAVRTVFWLLLGGLLVGLGGPFWYDTVKSLSSIRTLMGGAKPADKTETGAPVTSSGSTEPTTPVEHFNIAAAGRAAMLGLDQAEDDAAVG